MKKHTIYGERIIPDEKHFDVGRKIARHHHEKWNGEGYPDGLRWEEIPFPARIVTIADVFDALVSDRPYKEAFDYEQTRGILENGDDRLTPETHFDPDIHRIVLENYEEFVEIHEKQTPDVQNATVPPD